MKNYWEISQDFISTGFRIDFDENNCRKILIETLEKIVRAGKEEDFFFITDSTLEKDKGEEFISVYRESYNEKRKGEFSGNSQDLLWLLFARGKQFGGDKYDFYGNTKLSFYGNNGEIKTEKIHSIQVIYPFLNPNRLKFMKPSQSSIWDSFEIELSINEKIGIQLTFSSGLGIWSAKIYPDKDNFLDSKDLNEKGIIENYELFNKNVPKLKNFINQVSQPILKHGGRITHDNVTENLNM